MRVLRAIFCASLLVALSWSQDKSPTLDASRLRTGSFRYRTLVNGKPDGESLIQIRKSEDGDLYTFSNTVSGAFSQSWEAVASRAFVPVSAKLIFGEGSRAKPAFELSYSGGRVSGFVEKASERRNVNDAVAADTVDQRIDWAAVMSLKDYRADDTSKFHVYDPGTGNSRVTVTIGKAEIVQVLAGRFEAVRVVYRIDKNRGTEEYRVLVSKGFPRMMVKEEFPNGAVTELVEVKP